MANKDKVRDGRTSDLTFTWMLTTLGPEWEPWQKLATKWIAEQNTAITLRLTSLSGFFAGYLFECAPYAIEPALFFKGHQGHMCSAEELEAYIKRTSKKHNCIRYKTNYTCEFIEFVIRTVFSATNELGEMVPMVINPFRKIKLQASTTETIRNPLPYRYIQE